MLGRSDMIVDVIAARNCALTVTEPSSDDNALH